VQDDLQSAEAQDARAACDDYYQSMESLLQASDYLCGDFSYADIAFFMAALFGERMSAVLTGDTPRLLAWRDRMYARDAVRKGVEPLKRHLLSAGRPVPEFMSK
jgi:glutathione S-transferase